MDFRMQEALRRSRLYLVQNVEFDTLRDHLIDQDIFPGFTLERISAGSDRVEKVRRTLDELIRRPTTCFEKFQIALINSSQGHCADTILQHYVQSGPTQASDETPGRIESFLRSASQDVEMASAEDQAVCFPAYGFPETESSACYASGLSTPVQESSSDTASELTVSSLGKLCVPSEHGDDDHLIEIHQQRNSAYNDQYFKYPFDVYQMESNPRGLALVVNNEQFMHMSPRQGSKMDLQNLHKLFKMLGYAVCYETNKTAQEMRQLLFEYSQMPTLATVHSLAVVILSHGGRHGVIYGIDGVTVKEIPTTQVSAKTNTYITDDEVRDFFRTRKCPHMANKPKLIVIQACRGNNEDFTSPSSESSDNSDSHLQTEGGSPPSSVSSAGSRRAADMADMCLIHSSPSGYVSYRDPNAGSPFITTLTNVFMEYAEREHLLDIMTRVTNKLSAWSLTHDDRRSVPSTTHMLTKKWFMNPLFIPA